VLATNEREGTIDRSHDTESTRDCAVTGRNKTFIGRRTDNSRRESCVSAADSIIAITLETDISAGTVSLFAPITIPESRIVVEVTFIDTTSQLIIAIRFNKTRRSTS
jgi:hypothetical protein